MTVALHVLCVTMSTVVCTQLKDPILDGTHPNAVLLIELGVLSHINDENGRITGFWSS